jgi:hypothetical protein
MLRLTDRIKKEVAILATSSFYRFNAGNSDCYAFSLIKDEAGLLWKL